MCASDCLTLLPLWRGPLLFAQGMLRYTPVAYDPVRERRHRMNLEDKADDILYFIIVKNAQLKQLGTVAFIRSRILVHLFESW